MSSLLAVAGGEEEVTVESVTIDSFLSKRAVERVAVCKIDIEGAEIGALEGAAESLKRHAISHLIIEVHDNIIGDDGVKKLFELLEGSGYDTRFILKDVRRGPLGRMLAPASYRDVHAGPAHAEYGFSRSASVDVAAYRGRAACGELSPGSAAAGPRAAKIWPRLPAPTTQ